MTAPVERAVGAPVSWGVGEVPGRAYAVTDQPGFDTRLDTRLDVVLGQMRTAGLTATELGPDGFLPAAPDRCAAVLDAEGLRGVAGAVTLVAHDPAYDPEPALVQVLERLVACGASTVVLVASAGASDEPRPELDAEGWAYLLTELDRLAAVAATHGVQAALLPRQGSMVESLDDVARVLDDASVDLCLDTAHALLAGGDPVALARTAATRVAHVRLQDVDGRLAARLGDRVVSDETAVAQGLYVPLGKGCAAPLDVVRALEHRGYAGWYVLEQDAVPTAAQDGETALADVRASLAALAEVTT